MNETEAILGLGTALPEHRVVQEDAARSIASALAASPGERALVKRVFRLAGVETRFSCVRDFGARGPGPLLAVPPPSTASRMELYAAHAAELAATAGARALEAARVAASEVDHIVLVSCTGFVAPGVDVQVASRLGLATSVERTVVGFMGCHGAFNGLRVARALARDGATVLLVCVELCSIHVQADSDRDALVSSALFGDGAAAAVVGREESDRPALVRLGAAASRLIPDEGAHMAWRIGDTGFLMRLSSYVPALLGADLGGFVGSLLDGDVPASWTVHPGGPAILRRVESTLNLRRDALDASRETLRSIGNVSSATVLFVLEREARRLVEGDTGVMLGFGPGLTIEGLRFTRGPARVVGEAATTSEVSDVVDPA